MFIRRIVYKNNFKHKIIKRYFFNSIHETKITEKDILIFQNSMNSLFIFCSFLWAIETNHKLNKLNNLYKELFNQSFIKCKRLTKNNHTCLDIFNINVK